MCLAILKVKCDSLQLLGIGNNTTKEIWSILGFMILFLGSGIEDSFVSTVEW